jgi:putative ABC transport system permease protein
LSVCWPGRGNGRVRQLEGRAVVIPVEAWSGGIASAILIGAFAGLMPAVRASRMPPTVALRTV